MKKKILILGKNEQLGNALINSMQKNHCLMNLDKNTGNIENKQLIEKRIIEFNPDFIINAAAYTNVEKAEITFFLPRKIPRVPKNHQTKKNTL